MFGIDTNIIYEVKVDFFTFILVTINHSHIIWNVGNQMSTNGYNSGIMAQISFISGSNVCLGFC